MTREFDRGGRQRFGSAVVGTVPARQRRQSGHRTDVERIVVAPELIHHRTEAGAIVGPALYAEGIVDDAVDPRPLVPGEAASETDCG